MDIRKDKYNATKSLTVDRPVTHAAGGGQGRDSGGQHSDNHLHGIAIRFEI